MPSGKKTYPIQTVVILAIFFFVLFALVFRLIVDLRAESIKKETRQIETQRIKQEFIPKIHLGESVKLSEDINIEEDTSTEVFIRIPGYGQYFNISDLPILLEGVALSVAGDYSDSIVWSSHIDGELGKGKKIAARLSVGEHQITAVGTNGITKGSMTTRIFIEKDPDFLKYYRKK